MAAQADRMLHPFSHAASRERILTAFYACIALATVAIGVLGLKGESWLRRLLESCVNVHALFAVLLCGLVLARCWWRVERSPRLQPADIRDLSRHLSRIVYLLLYVVIGMSELIAILNSVWHGVPLDFNPFDTGSRQGPDHAGFDLKDDAQVFLASGFFALLFVRVLAFTLWSRVARRAAASKASTGNEFGAVDDFEARSS
jgi:cytochrome b561